MYKINVSNDGGFQFRIEDNIHWLGEVRKIADKLEVVFPECDGYEITISQWSTTGQELER